MLKIKLSLCLLCFLSFAHAQVTLQQDSSSHHQQQDSLIVTQNSLYKLNYKNFIVPAVFIGYGVASLSIDGLKKLNTSTRDEINEHQPDHIRLDNYTQYVPAVLVYGLNAFGVKSKHNFRDRTLIYATSQLLSAAMVVPLKHLVHEERPDGTNSLSFPSGHTATAFSSAQFMYREYRDSNFWLSISGYPFAVFTGVYRTLNDKHWVGDVVAGAGFGILSTELAYWLHPKINSLFFPSNKPSSSMIMPFYQDKKVGLSFVKQL
ncbi:phosphatase PAP2 family protein [Sphingobacterium sp. SRCM116780]|uniref:phosphatase PAP2 family protein n=1 Tax=Sphingobacterium sp. SRCM116780 TaxID=2907623 RepID=UPI001F171B37|nr:phosphatase PAP2 family protein [Sphingobacterium sp. SRCM116780]UIR57354.1 phosphatase PAP2 family protein [Sphingobacterium sp. SRCM116780]